MKIIQKISYGSANFIATQLGEGHLKRGEYYFGFQFIYSGILKISVLVTLALAFNTMRSVVFIVLAFTSIRFYAGGVHMDTYARCLFITLAAFIPASLVSKHFCYLFSGYTGIMLILLVFALVLFIFIRHAPENPPVNQVSEKENTKLKACAIGLLIFWTCASCCMLILGNNELAASICFGILIEGSTVAPVGVSIYSKINKIGAKK